MNLSYLWAELSRRPGRTLAATLSVAVGVALFVSLQAYAAGYRQAARAPLAQIGADIAAQRQGDVPEAFEGPVFPHSTAPIHPAEIAAIRRLPGVEAVGEAVLFWDFEPDRFLVVLGFEPPASAGEAVGPARLQAAVQAGRFLNPDERGAAVVDISFAQENNLGVGDVVPIAGRSFAIVGLVDTSRAGQVANANLYIPLADAREISSVAPNVLAVHNFGPADANILFIKANQAQAETVATAATDLLGKQALVSSARSFSEVLGASFRLIDQFGWVVGLAGLLVAIAGLLRSVAVNLGERRRDIALMRAVGWRRADIVRQLTAEALALAFAGGLAGLGLAVVITLILSQTSVTIPVPWELSPTPHFLPGGALEMGLTIPLPAHIEMSTVLTALTLALLCGAGVGLVLAGRAANKKPAEVLQNE
jgi:putative ABC transport system permease protein